MPGTSSTDRETEQKKACWPGSFFFPHPEEKTRTGLTRSEFLSRQNRFQTSRKAEGRLGPPCLAIPAGISIGKSRTAPRPRQHNRLFLIYDGPLVPLVFDQGNRTTPRIREGRDRKTATVLNARKAIHLPLPFLSSLSCQKESRYAPWGSYLLFLGRKLPAMREVPERRSL